MALQCIFGISTNTQTINEELFQSYAAAGVEAMEVSDDLDVYAAMDFEEVRRLADKYGIRLWSLHLPYSLRSELDLSNPALAEQTVEILKYYIDKAMAIGIKLFVVHTSGEPIEDAERPGRMACAKNSLKKLAEYAKAVGCTVAVEDLPRSCLGRDSAEILELLSVDESLRACFDFNHLLRENTLDFIRKVGHKIITLHVSDYDYINERHWLPGEGDIDWPAAMQALEEAGYQGCWMYETYFIKPKLLVRDRALTHADIRKNYEELMTGMPLTVLGRRTEN